MSITLAQAQVNVQDDVDYAVIDNLRRYSWLLDHISFDDCVNPGTGGATLTYGYTRLVSAASAAFRAINSEYVAGQATRKRHSVDLVPLGGKFSVDRVLANLGASATNEVTFQLQQLITAIHGRFQQEVICGYTNDDNVGFDGLSVALTGADTEFNADASKDWTAATISDTDKANTALDVLDEFLSSIVPSHTGGGSNGQPGALPPGVKAILGNTKSITRVRSIARRAGMYTNTKDDLGRQVEAYGPWTLVDLGDRMAGASPIIPVLTRSEKWTITLTSASAGTFTVTVDGATTPAQDYNVSKDDLQAALEALPTVGTGNVTVALASSVYTITFNRYAGLSADTSNITGGTPAVATSGTATADNLTDLYAVTFGDDSLHGVSVRGAQLVRTWMPDFEHAGAVKDGEAEMGPVATVLKNSKAAGVLRNVKVA